ncbi:flagellar assembly protein FliH [Massilia horti]|uniref:Flagellar assembly protein FliH n=2 Tax=Massilia horti TaxID=2562153 RepID=A0A4Y9SYA6_9BURK|nr:flagellar assembly protein FliH [Massilia horti]
MTSFDTARPSAAPEPIEPPPPPAPVVHLPTQAEVDAIRETARQQGFAEGHAEGHAAGYAEGQRAGANEAQEQLAHLQGVASAFGQAVAAADETIAGEVLDLALHLARAMLRTAFEVKPELIIPVVREAIEYLPALQQPALLMLHPEDADIVRNGIGEELDKGGWRVVPDPAIARGGCKIDTATNQIDAQAQVRWQRLAHSLGKNVEWLGP